MRSMPKGQGGYPLGAGADLAPEQMTVVVDFAGYSIFNAPPTQTSLETLRIMLNHYPERLGCAVLLSPPTLFQVFWGVAQPFLDARTVAKIHFIDPATPAGAAQLGTLLDLSQLDASLGGTGGPEGALPWDAAAYDARVIAEERAFRDADAKAAAAARKAQLEAQAEEAAAL